MKLFEFEAKSILWKHGIVTAEGNIASTPEEAEAIAKSIGKPVALKSQVLVSSRWKSGGIKFADDSIEARGKASELFGSSVRGAPVRSLLVEEKLEIKAQYYASVTIDR